jgi:hypothetical protein
VWEPSMAESQLAELQTMRVLMEEARVITRNLAYHRRAKIEARLDLVLVEIERQIEELRVERSERRLLTEKEPVRRKFCTRVFGG